MLQSIALQIIDIQFDPNKNDVILGLGKANDKTIELAMNVDRFWDNLNLST